MKTAIPTLLYLLLQLCFYNCYSQIPNQQFNSGWILNPTVSDEFNSAPTVDYNKWFDVDNNYITEGADQIAKRRSGNLTQHQDPTNPSNYIARITTKAENITANIPGTTTTWNYNYTTGMLKSKSRIKFGYFEIRFKLESENTVVSPNFWLYSGSDASSSHQYYSEIDGFEVKSCDPNRIPMNAYFKSSDLTPPQNNYYRLPKQGNPLPIPYLGPRDYYNPNFSLFGNWNVFGIEWLPERVNYYLNGNLINSFDEWCDFSDNPFGPQPSPCVTNVKLIDAALQFGGYQTGNPNNDIGLNILIDVNLHDYDKIDCISPAPCPSCITNSSLIECNRGSNWICDPKPPNPFPTIGDENHYEIDYVRVYSLECNPTSFSCNSGFTWPTEIRSIIKYNSPNCLVPSNSEYAIRAVEYIEINDGFEIPLNTKFFIDNTHCFDTFTNQ